MEIIKIELGESDAVLNDGVPKMVNLTITLSNNKRVTFPYAAKKTISQIYKDVHDNIARLVDAALASLPQAPHEYQIHRATVEKKNVSIDANTIQREDIVKCIKVLPRDPGADVDIVLNGEYRVIDIYKINGVLENYEVIDDAAATRRRITVYPEEIQLLRKAGPRPEKSQAFEMIKRCVCGNDVALYLDEPNNIYAGKCDVCETLLTATRKTSANV